jgi:hypothetical protein
MSPTITQSVLDYVVCLPPTSHAVFCYENLDHAYEVFRAYVRGATERAEAVRILCSSKRSYDVFLQSAKLSPTKDHVNYVEMSAFSSKTGFNSEKALSLAKSELDATRKLGFKGLRLFSLGNEYLNYASLSDVLQFEKQLGLKFPSSMSGICAYDIRGSLGDEALSELLKAHGNHIFQGVAG